MCVSGKKFLVEGTASAKALRQEHSWYDWRLKRDQCGPSRVTERKRKGEVREIGKCNHSGSTLRQLWWE